MLAGINYEINHTITYEKDARDIWQSPSQTLEKGTGDCEDIALFKLGLALKSGHEAWLERCWIDEQFTSAHMVCIVKVEKKGCLLRRARVVELVLDNRTDFIYNREESGLFFVNTLSNKWTYDEALERCAPNV